VRGSWCGNAGKGAVCRKAERKGFRDSGKRQGKQEGRRGRKAVKQGSHSRQNAIAGVGREDGGGGDVRM
jgi:hypothetical protein